MMYLLDANIFIQAHRTHYGMDFVPAFWEWLEQGNQAGFLGSIKKIRAELTKLEDEVSDWVKTDRVSFVEMDEATREPLARLADWASSGGVNYRASAVTEFLSSGDYQLVAYAMAHGCTVVTHEVPAPDSKKRVKIPDACVAMGVSWMNPFDMLRSESVRFVLDA